MIHYISYETKTVKMYLPAITVREAFPNPPDAFRRGPGGGERKIKININVWLGISGIHQRGLPSPRGFDNRKSCEKPKKPVPKRIVVDE
jgi:hypothetical protein